MSISIGKFVFSSKHKDHKDCENYTKYINDINVAFNDGVTYREQIEYYIREMKKRIYDAMDIYVRSVMDSLLNDYIELLKTHGKTDIGVSGDYVMYKWITERLSPKLKDYVRKIINENDVLKKVDNNTWEDYIKVRIDDAHSTSWQFLEQNYIRFDAVTLTDVRDKYNKSYDAFLKESEDYWEVVIKLKKEYKIILDEVDKKYGAIYKITSHF